MQIAYATAGPSDLPDRSGLETRPEVSRPEPPERSPWPVLIAGLIVTVGAIVVLGALFSMAFAVMVAGVLAVMVIALAWAVTHPPDPVP
jgi:hypothetical protein